MTTNGQHACRTVDRLGRHRSCTATLEQPTCVATNNSKRHSRVCDRAKAGLPRDACIHPAQRGAYARVGRTPHDAAVCQRRVKAVHLQEGNVKTATAACTQQQCANVSNNSGAGVTLAPPVLGAKHTACAHHTLHTSCRCLSMVIPCRIAASRSFSSATSACSSAGSGLCVSK